MLGRMIASLGCAMLLAGCTSNVDLTTEFPAQAPQFTLSNCENLWAPSYAYPINRPQVNGWLDAPAPILQDRFGIDALLCQKWSYGNKIIENATLVFSSRSNQQPPDSCMEHFDFYPQLIQGIVVSHSELYEMLNWGPFVETSEIDFRLSFTEGDSTAISFKTPTNGQVDISAEIMDSGPSDQGNTLTLALPLDAGVRFIEIALGGEGTARTVNSSVGEVSWPAQFSPPGSIWIGGLTQYRDFSTTIKVTDFANTECTEYA